MDTRRASAAVLLVVFAGASAVACGQEYSALWGRAGEKFSPKGRLPDFSFAGYRRGEKPLPRTGRGVSVKSFGATGDGKTDDSAAFLAAIKKTDRGVIFIPAGRYVITKVLRIAKSGLVLKGAGPRKTILVFPKGLMDVEPRWSATTSGRKTSSYSWSGGFIVVHGQIGGEAIGTAAPAKRGDTLLTLSSVGNLRPGRDIRITVQDDRARSLTHYLYAGQSGDIRKLRRVRASHLARVVSVRGGKVLIDRPLPFDLRKEWGPRVAHFAPSVTEVGVEEMGFEFVRKPYKGHFTEWGYNALAFSAVAHCWARNIRVFNSDSGVFASGSVFCTIDGLELDADRPASRGDTGHHGVQFTGNDCLLTNFNFKTRFIHDLTVARCSGNVFASGRGADLSFDHHRYAPFANLFTDIDIGKGSRMYHCGGGRALGRHSAAWTTFWNIRAQRPQGWPGGGFGPDLMNIVGVTTRDKTVTSAAGRWFEAISPDRLKPANLYTAQRERRLGPAAR